MNRLVLTSRLLPLAATLVVASCNWGTRPKDFPPANGPQGATVTLQLRAEQGTRTGELFAADSLGVTVLAPRLVHVAWSRLELLHVSRLRAYDVSGNTPDQEQLAHLAGVSRFPQGLSGELLTRVLAALRQPTLEEIP